MQQPTSRHPQVQDKTTNEKLPNMEKIYCERELHKLNQRHLPRMLDYNVLPEGHLPITLPYLSYHRQHRFS